MQDAGTSAHIGSQRNALLCSRARAPGAEKTARRRNERHGETISNADLIPTALSQVSLGCPWCRHTSRAL